MSLVESNEDVIARLTEADPSLAQFLVDDFQSEEYAMKIVKSSVVADVLAQLGESIKMLNTELHQQISARHEDLLAQTTGIESLESVLDVMTARIGSLKELINRISARITEPFEKLQSRTIQLARLQDATDLLRRLIRLFYLTKRLRQQMAAGNNREITKAAQTLNELNFLENDGASLEGIHVIEEDREYIAKTRKQLGKEAHIILEKGMRSENPSSIATALQVFYNLDSLGSSVENVFNEICTNAEKTIQEAVDIRLLTDSKNKGTGGPGKANLNIGNQANLKANLWAALDDMAEQLYLGIVNIQQLQRVLVKKRDPISHVLFCDKLKKDGFEPNIGLRFWKLLLKKIEHHLRRAAQYNQVIKSAFELEYPRLLRIINTFWTKVAQNNEGYQLMFYGRLKNQSVIETFDLDLTRAEPTTDYQPEDELRQSIGSFKIAFNASNLNNLTSPIQHAFLSSVGHKQSSTPDDGDIEAICKAINYELGVAMFDSQLQLTVANNIEKAVGIFVAKVEGNINRSSQTSQIITAPNEAQQHNIAFANCLFYLSSSLDSIISENRDQMTQPVKMVLTESRDQLDQLMESILAPLFRSVSDSIEAIILTLHQEDYAIASYTTKKQSPFIREMDGFVKRVVRDHFSGIRAKTFVTSNLEPIASRALSLFVRHSTLIRPLTPAGRVKLSSEYVHIEDALMPLCSRLVDLGDSYRLLRSFKAYFSTPELNLNEISETLGETTPISLVIQMAISSAPEELRSPHQVADWSQSQYSQWLDEHDSEKERLALLKGTMENYVKSVQKAGGTEFVPQFTPIMELLKR